MNTTHAKHTLHNDIQGMGECPNCGADIAPNDIDKPCWDCGGQAMNTAKHTPGPWEHKGHRVYRKDSYAVAWIEQQGPHSEWQANGKLIAAAPAMYEALREVQELIRSLVAEEMIHSSELQRVGNCQANMWEALAQADGVGHE